MTNPIEALLEEIKAALHLKRREHAQRVQLVRDALDAYDVAQESKIAREFARDHSLSHPPEPPISSELARTRLLKALTHLLGPSGSETAPPAAAPTNQENTSVRSEPTTTVQPSHQTPFPKLTEVAQERPIAIVGGLVKPEKLVRIPAALRERMEWIDTARQGTHAIGNLAQRIKKKRVGGLVILDKLVQHKHSEPLVRAARESGVPTTYGAKGGQASLEKAMAALERMLTQEH